MTTVLALLGSPRPAGNNGRAMDAVLQGAAAAGKLEVRKIVLNQLTIRPSLLVYRPAPDVICFRGNRFD